MAPLKSILRSSSFLGRGQSTDDIFDEEDSVKATPPPFIRKMKAGFSKKSTAKAASQESRGEKGRRNDKDEARVDEPDLILADRSATFDSKIDTVISLDAFDIIESFVTMIASYEEDEAKSLPVEKVPTKEDVGLEITYENYVEFEKVRQQRLLEMEEGSEEATCGESVGSEEQLAKESPKQEEHPKEESEPKAEPPKPEKKDKRTPFEVAEDNFVHELWAPQFNRIKKLKEMNQTELRNIREQVARLREEATKRKHQRLLVSRPFEKKMNKNLKVLEESLIAQKKIEEDFETLVNKQALPKVRVVETTTVPEVQIEVPPPVQVGLEVHEYGEYESHFADEQPEVHFDDDALNDAVQEELNEKTESVYNTTKSAWGELSTFANDLLGLFCHDEEEEEA